MTDINDIQQDLIEIENNIGGLVDTKSAIKKAIESKLGATIPSENPLSMYDDYIYQIPVYDEKNIRVLELGDTNLGTKYQINFNQDNVLRDAIYFDPQGEIEVNNIPQGDPGDPSKNYSSLSGVIINRPSGLKAENIKSGIKIFGITGNAAVNGSDVSMVTARPQDVSGGDKVSTGAKIFVDDTGEPREGTLTDYRFETESELFVPIIPTSYNLDSETGNIVSFNSNIDENNFEIDNSHDVIINENTNLIFSVSNLNDLINDQLEPEKKILPENIKYGSSILGVDGTFSQILQGETAAKENYLLKGAVAYVNGKKITGRVPRKFYTDDITIKDGKLLVGAGIYWTSGCHDGSVFPRTLPEADFDLGYDENITTYTDKNDLKYLARHNEILVTPTLDINEEGYLLPNSYTESGTLIDGTKIINQNFFTDEYLDEHSYSRISPSRMLSGTLGVNQYGDILEGNIPIFTTADGNIEWTYNKYTDSGLITSPGSGSQWGYYTAMSNVLITEDRLKRAYNNYYSSDPTKQLVAGNIRQGVTLFGVEGEYSGAVNPVDRNISSAEINFSSGNTITFTPDLGDLYQSVTLNKSDNLIPRNIVTGKTIYGITGTFSNASTISQVGNKIPTGNQILTGYTAWGNGQEITGSMPNQGYLNSIIQDIWSPITFSSGYYSGGRVQVDPNQLINLTEINIREGITLFGVTGTYSGGKLIYLYHGYYDKVDPDLDSVPVIKLNDNNQIVINDINSNNRFCIFSDDINLNSFSSPQNNESSPLVKDFSPGTTAVFHIIPLVNNNTYRGYVVDECMGKISVYSSPTDTKPTVIFNEYMSPVDESFLRLYPTKGGFSYTHEMKKPTKVEFKLYENGHSGLTWEIKIIELPESLYDTSAADPNNGGASPEDVAAGKIFFNNTGSHNGTLIKTVITQNAETGVLTIV